MHRKTLKKTVILITCHHILNCIKLSRNLAKLIKIPNVEYMQKVTSA